MFDSAQVKLKFVLLPDHGKAMTFFWRYDSAGLKYYFLGEDFLEAV